jgi:hypothetical protein
MASGKLTSLSVERAHRFGGPVLLLSDGDGLYFRKQTREGAAWMFRYRFAGRERWMTLGNFPDMSLAAARIEAREKRLLLDKRRDPHQGPGLAITGSQLCLPGYPPFASESSSRERRRSSSDYRLPANFNTAFVAASMPCIPPTWTWKMFDAVLNVM